VEIKIDGKNSKTMNLRCSRGQGLLETVIVLPLLLIVLSGTYACIRAYFIVSAAEGAAHTEAIRVGRHLGGIEQQLSDSIMPMSDGNVVRIRSDAGDKAGILPAPFPQMAGRTKATVEVEIRWDEMYGAGNIPALKVAKGSEISVDCWDKRSPSGMKVHRVVTGIVATGLFR
jgi:hypothetical protein